MEKSIAVRKAVLEIVKFSLLSVKPDMPKNVDWEAVYNELCNQGVIGLTNDIVTELDLPEAVGNKWRASLLWQTQRYLTICQEQNELVEALNNNNIDFIILKGTAAAVYYPNPEYRQMGDIDIIVDTKDFERTRQVLEGLQYKVSEDMKRHISYKNSSVEVELHRIYAEMNNTDISNKINQQIFSSLHNPQWISLPDTTFPALSDLENGLTLLLHLNQHMEKGIGLRQVIDWLMFVNEKLDDDLWNESFGKCAKEIGLDTLAITVTYMGQMFIGLPKKKLNWCKGADKRLCTELMDYIFRSGNLGCGYGQCSDVINAVLNTNEQGIFRNLEARGIYNWAACRKHKWLKPFAWIYQIFRYIKKISSMEKPLQTTKKGLWKANERPKLLARLGVDCRNVRT
jgi:hypothetical protein